MMNKIRKIARRSEQAGIIILILISIGVSGTGFNETLRETGLFKFSVYSCGSSQAELNSVPESDEENLTRNNRNYYVSPASLVFPLQRTEKTEDKIILKTETACLHVDHAGSGINYKTQVLKSASMVSSRLGRQFTLVGARPSGTS